MELLDALVVQTIERQVIEPQDVPGLVQAVLEEDARNPAVAVVRPPGVVCDTEAEVDRSSRLGSFSGVVPRDDLQADIGLHDCLARHEHAVNQGGLFDHPLARSRQDRAVHVVDKLSHRLKVEVIRTEAHKGNILARHSLHATVELVLLGLEEVEQGDDLVNEEVLGHL